MNDSLQLPADSRPGGNRRWLLLVMDAVWLLALAGYVLAGTALVPFHGDESTIIMMSQDYHDLFLRGNTARLVYHPPLYSDERQALRLLNGTLSPYLIGFAWNWAGFTVADLNRQWDWQADWNWNITDGHRPSDDLLLASRWPLAVLTALSVVVLFALAKLWRGRWAAYPASLLLALHPVVLVNGRRAMFEGDLLFFGVLTVTLAAFWAQYLRHRKPRAVTGSLTPWLLGLGMGLAAGLAFASKHTGLIPAVAGYLALSVVISHQTQDRQPRDWLPWIVSVTLAAFVFLALNPAWWNDPVGSIGRVLSTRTWLVSEQSRGFPEAVYPDLGARLGGMVGQLSTEPIVYYESSDFAGHLDAEIAAYEASPWAGIPYGTSTLTSLLGIGLLLLAAVGAVKAVWDVRAGNAAALTALLWTGLTALTILLTIPLAWQRYYMPLYPAEVLLAGVAASYPLSSAGKWALRRAWLAGRAAPTATAPTPPGPGHGGPLGE